MCIILALPSFLICCRLFDHPDSRIQEQAFNIVRNLADNEDGIDLVFQEMGVNILLDRTRTALESTDDDVTQQAALTLANLVNGNGNDASQIITFPRMLAVLHSCLSDRKTDIRRPICSIVCELAQTGGTEGRKALVDEGFGSTLKRIVEWAGSLGTGSTYVGSPSGTSALSSSLVGTSPVQQTSYMSGLRREFGGRVPSPMRYHRIEEDKKLTEMAKLALDWLEHGDAYTGNN